MNKESMYNPYEELPLMPGIDPKYKKYRKIAKMSLLFSFLAFVLAAVSLHDGSRYHGRHSNHQGPSNDCDMPASSAAVIDELMDASIIKEQRCYGEWEYSTQQVFTVPEGDTGLIIGSKFRGTFSGKKTNAVIVLNPALTTPKVTFDLHFSDLENQDEAEKRVHIDVLDGPEGIFHLTVVADGRRHNRYEDPLCFNYDVTVEVPTLDALDRLSLGVPHSDITVQEAFTFEEYLRLSNAKGDIEFAKDGVRAGSLKLSTASGHIQIAGVVVSTGTSMSTASGNIQAAFDKLAGDVKVSASSGNVALAVDTLAAANDQHVKLSTASGNVGLKVNKIEEGHKQIDMSAASGDVDAVLPDTFISEFKLSGIRGRLEVEADDPQQIHYNRKGTFDLLGHYGDAHQATGAVSLSAVSGDIKLKYISQHD